MPQQLHITGTIEPEVRYRGIYEAVLYHSRIELNGRFSVPALSELGLTEEQIRWQDSFIALGITDLKGVQDAITVTVATADIGP